MITAYFVFVNEAAAKAALPDYWIDNGDNTWEWRGDCVAGPLSVLAADGSLDVGYHLNIGVTVLPQELQTASGFIGARDANGFVAGTKPNNPQFAFS